MFIEIHRRGRGGREGEGGGGGQWREAIGVGIKGFGAGRFAFSIWRMLPPPSRISGPCKPREKPLLPAWYRLIYSRKVAIVDIKPATPTFIPVDTRYACVYICVCALHGEWCRLTHFIHHLTFANVISIPPSTPFISSLARIVRYIGRNGYARRWIICAARLRSVENWKFLWKEVDRFERGENVEIMWKSKRPLSGVGSGKMEDRVRRE